MAYSPAVCSVICANIVPKQARRADRAEFCIADADPISYNRLRSWLLTTNEETRVTLTCPSCGNDQNFLVKTLQMHVVHLDDSRVEVSEEGRPAVLEVLCDECETALSIDEMDDGLRKELLLTLGAR
jgi:hypothetical protein